MPVFVAHNTAAFRTELHRGASTATELVVVATMSTAEVDTAPATDTAGGEQSEAPTGNQFERKTSALRDNIKEKGQYSYYYGHTMDTPEVRAEREAALRIQAAQAAGATEPVRTKIVVQKQKTPISQYSWSDGKKRVTVYIPAENFDIPESQEEFASRVTLEHTVKSVQFTIVDNASQYHFFHVPQLYDEITKATFKYAPEKNRISLVLTKKSAFTWANLRRQK